MSHSRHQDESLEAREFFFIDPHQQMGRNGSETFINEAWCYQGVLDVCIILPDYKIFLCERPDDGNGAGVLLHRC